jgi:site-specific DNA recombinase
MTPLQTAIYARVASAQQAEAQTVASHVAALRERVAAADLPLPEALPCLDAGESGPRGAGAVDRLSVHAPDRWARPYADPGLRVDEVPHAGVEVIFLNRELGPSPEDDLLRQGQGLMAASERAKMLARHRRGTRHAARAGPVNVRSGAPDGSHDLSTDERQGQARDAAVPDEARVVRQVCDWGGRDRLTSGAVGRRLTQAGDVTRRGQPLGARRVVGGMVTNPA